MINLDRKKFENGRYERKFVISELKLQEIEHLIKFHKKMFCEIFYKRRVNNLYLDSPGKNNYMDNVNGNNNRLKIRIRWYGKLFGIIGKPVLELKMKNGEVGEKKSFLLKSFEFDKDFSYNLLQKIFEESNLPSWLLEILKAMSPSLLNSYNRRYFISADKKCRLTLDSDLTFFEIRNIKNLFCHKKENKREAILELKYHKKYDEEISKITQYFPFRMTKSSKYVSGIDLLKT